MEETIIIKNKKNLKLVGVISKPEGTKIPLVVLCHGFSSGKNSKINRMLVPKLLDIGIASLRFDFSGHYDSEGDIADVTISNSVEDLSSAINYVTNNDWVDLDKIGLFGSSYGGTVALWFTAIHGGIQALALRSPISDYKAVREQQLGEQGIIDWRKTGFTMLENGTVKSN